MVFVIPVSVGVIFLPQEISKHRYTLLILGQSNLWLVFVISADVRFYLRKSPNTGIHSSSSVRVRFLPEEIPKYRYTLLILCQRNLWLVFVHVISADVRYLPEEIPKYRYTLPILGQSNLWLVFVISADVRFYLRKSPNTGIHSSSSVRVRFLPEEIPKYRYTLLIFCQSKIFTWGNPQIQVYTPHLLSE